MLVVEDGTGRADAEALSSVAFATTYHAKLGNTAWAALTNNEMEIALRLGARYMVHKWRLQLMGQRINEVQALDFPRYGLYTPDGFYVPSDSVPVWAAEVNAELALISRTQDLMPDETTPGQVTAYKVQVGPLKEETTWSGSGRSSMPRFSKVEAMMAPYLENRGGNGKVWRG